VNVPHLLWYRFTTLYLSVLDQLTDILCHHFLDPDEVEPPGIDLGNMMVSEMVRKCRRGNYPKMASNMVEEFFFFEIVVRYVFFLEL
jgi:hypothetical protein